MSSFQFAVILSGCGVYDGAEIHEATLSLLSIAKSGNQYQCFAPNVMQHHVINHLTGNEMPETRNVLVEAARIARGKIKGLSEYNPNDYDALIIPGGFGVAKNLSSQAFDGPNLWIEPSFANAILKTAEAQKPIGALCIAPAVLTKVLKGAKVTIGNEPETINVIKALGGNHETTSNGQVVVDDKYQLVTTPCYMLNTTIDQIASSTDNLVDTIIKMLKKK